MLCTLPFAFFFFFNDTATTEIYTLSLHDALPILSDGAAVEQVLTGQGGAFSTLANGSIWIQMSTVGRSEEHTSELQSRQYLVCRLLLEKKKKIEYFRSGQRVLDGEMGGKSMEPTA